jgi:hypothetical protein
VWNVSDHLRDWEVLAGDQWASVEMAGWQRCTRKLGRLGHERDVTPPVVEDRSISPDAKVRGRLVDCVQETVADPKIDEQKDRLVTDLLSWLEGNPIGHACAVGKEPFRPGGLGREDSLGPD